MSEVWRLFQIQQIDTRIAEIEKAVVRLRGDDEHLVKFAALEAECQELEATQKQQKKELRELELEDGTLRARAKALSDKLYGGRITNPKELQTFEEELAHAKARIDAVEEDILTRMEAVEGGDADLAARCESLEKARKERDLRQADLDAEGRRLVVELKGLRDQRGKLAAETEANSLKRYDDLRTKKHGLAVVRIVHGSCAGCNMHLTDMKVQQARSETITTCGTCGRILFVET